LLELLLPAAERQGLLVIGADRDCEVGAACPLLLTPSVREVVAATRERGD
jgi:hypothetical protein